MTLPESVRRHLLRRLEFYVLGEQLNTWKLTYATAAPRAAYARPPVA